MGRSFAPPGGLLRWALPAALCMGLGLVAPATATAQAAPPAPTGLTVTAVGPDRITLEWNGSWQDDHRIHWQVAGQPGQAGSQDANGTYAGPGRVRAGLFGLDFDTTYLLHVVEVVNGVESPPSNQVTATTLTEVPVDVRVVSSSETVVHLGWTGVFDHWYRVDWREADDPQSTGSETVQYRQSYPHPRPPGVNLSVGGLSASTTYVFEVVHLDGGPDGQPSAPSEPVVFTTPPYDPPAVGAELDGNDVTLSWPKPANLPAQVVAHYDVYVDGVLETRVSTAEDPARVTLPRQTAGTTPEYTVLHTDWNPPSVTDPVAVAIPEAADTTPPTPPGWIFTTGPPLDCGETPEMPMYEIVELSTDLTTAQGDIHYEGFTRHPLTGELYVDDYELPLSGPEAPERIRAVDEAGNRSVATAGRLVVPDC